MFTYKLKIKKDYDQYLNKFFEKINDKDFIWDLEYVEVYDSNFKSIFNEKIIKNKDFQEIISKNKPHFIIHLHICLYENEISLKNKKWILELKIDDSEYVTIMVADDDIDEIIKENIRNIEKESQKEAKK